MKKGLLLINLGTPKSTRLKDVRAFLKTFLLDKRVVDLPLLLRALLVFGVILPFRAPATKKAYEKIWTLKGSPLQYLSAELETLVNSLLPQHYHCQVAMRYGQPSIKNALDNLINMQCEEITIVPLFPQYASASSGSAIAKALEEINQLVYIPTIKVVQQFYHHHAYINALVDHIRSHDSLKNDHYVFSYHGLPVRQIKDIHHDVCDMSAPCPLKGINTKRCYRSQCYQTTNMVTKKLGIPSDNVTTSFQSRLGRIPWITPYTDDRINELYEKGVRHLTLICPSFVTDCLETLEEIAIQLKKQWLALGGKSFHFIPSLNVSPAFAKAIISTAFDNPSLKPIQLNPKEASPCTMT